MKKSSFILCLILLLPLAGCKKNFSSFFEQARKDFSEKNYINAVDNINVGLLQWKESDGIEAKAEAYQILGISYQQLRNTDKAIESYQQAIQLSTRTFSSAYALGMLHLTRSQPSEALATFEKALAMKKDDPSSLLGKANSLYALRRHKDAYEVYQRILDVSPGVREALESIAILKNRFRKKETVLPARSSNPRYKAPAKSKDPSLSIKKSKKKK